MALPQWATLETENAGMILTETASGGEWVWTGKKVFHQGTKWVILKSAPDNDPGHKPYRLLPDEDLEGFVPAGIGSWPVPVTEWAYTAVRHSLRDSARADSSESEIEKYKKDWSLLNTELNDYAEDQGMCEEYERRLDQWNANFGTASLTGRLRKYSVTVEITATFENVIDVEATSPSNALEKADDLGWDEVCDGLDISDATNVDWESSIAG